ncbi:MAG: hypothetical protein ACRYG7_36155 [Janthinobacterium lividum]
MQNFNYLINKRNTIKLLLCCAFSLASSAQASAVTVGADKPSKAVGPNEKVVICHNGHEISVSVNALQAHLAHGDQVGSCSSGGGTGDVPIIWARNANKPSPTRR